MKKILFPPLVIIILLTISKQLLWIAAVPVWQAPDEQAHFSQLQYYAENKTLTLGRENLSLEVATSEQLLGTFRDQFGNNQYTYHREFNIPYSNATIGQEENKINNLLKSSRTQYVGQEAAGYPPLYYVLDLPFYNAVYNQGLIDRIFAGRLLSVILNLLLVGTAYYIGKTIWGKGIMPAVLALMVGFQPMVSFVSAGIHPDNLLNLLYSLGILLLLLILKNGNRPKYLFFLAATLFLGLETKPLMFIFIPVAAAVVAYQAASGRAKLLLPAVILLSPVIVFLANLHVPYIPFVGPASPLVGMSFFDYLRFRIPKMAFEIWPWYWGVFKWLGVTLPPLVLKVVTRVAIIAGLGLALRLITILRRHKSDFETKAIILFLLSSFFYVLYLVFWDWRLMQANGFSQGLQGRYLFPNIVPHMALLLIGLLALIPAKMKKLRLVVPCIIAAAMILLNSIAFQTVAKSYYDLASRQKFSVQFVQYKPQLIKSLFAPASAKL